MTAKQINNERDRQSPQLLLGLRTATFPFFCVRVSECHSEGKCQHQC